MSATIFWERSKQNNKSLGVSAPSAFLTAMSEAGMGVPCTVGHAEYDKLNAMAAAYGGPASENPYRKLCNLIIELPEDTQTIRLWTEY
jgi:hypothetical protein